MVTLKDIATELGVSIKMVSRALNGSDYVKKERSEQIIRTARKMGYVVDDIARSIKTGKTKVIGFVSGSPEEEYTAKIINGLSVFADSHDYMIKIINGRYLGYKPDEYKKIARTCIEKRLSALVIHGVSNIDVLKNIKSILAKNRIEMALISNNSSVNDCIEVKSCDSSGIAKAVNYLYDLGHRDFLFMSPGLEYMASVVRQGAYIKELKRLGVKKSRVISDTIKNHPALLDELFSQKGNRPTAIICSGDNIAMFTQGYLTCNYDIKIPSDISIIGYGDFRSGRECYPALTTVYEPFKEMGRMVVDKLIARLEGRDFGKMEEFIETELIVRGSTAPPPKEKK